MLHGKPVGWLVNEMEEQAHKLDTRNKNTINTPQRHGSLGEENE